MIKFDKDHNITKEYKEYIQNLSREDLEIFAIGADALAEQLQEKNNKAIEYIEQHILATETEDMLLNILKGEDKK